MEKSASSYWGSLITRWLPWFQPKEEAKSRNPGQTSYPVFTGSKKALERYLGPTLHQLVEETSSKNPRRCQRCKSGHIDLMRRKAVDSRAVIEAALEFHRQGDRYFVNLEQLEQHLIEVYREQVAATPVLCRECLRRRQLALVRESYKFPDLSVYKTPELKLGPNLVSSGPVETRTVVSEGLEKLCFTASEFESFRSMKIGKLVCHTLPRMIRSNGLSEGVIIKLQDPEYCKMMFDVNFPVLIKLPRYASKDTGKDKHGRQRYYVQAVKWKGSGYLITSQWSAGSHELYLKWLRRKAVVRD